MITVVDYGRGNLFSLARALEALNRPFTITDQADEIGAAETIILPGVGAFGDAMGQLMAGGLDLALKDAADRGARIVGICLGMQLLATKSEEFGDHAGLDLIPGEVRRLPAPTAPCDTRIPNMGWRRVQPQGTAKLIDGGPDPAYFYFVHSFGFHAPDPDHVVGTITVNGATIAAAVNRDNIWGCQFHPEKSGAVGLDLLDRLCRT
tara:strand:+ start:129 stop:746 length:618 start_codon:yes stop_codon:yes gene_type:complete